MYALLAIAPIFLAVILMVAFNVNSGLSLISAWAVGCVVALSCWKMNLLHVAAYSLMGAATSVDTILIIFCAIFLLNALIRMGYIESISNGFNGITNDRRIQILIIGWLFGCFMEGAAGFGTPAALAAPLLVGLGIPAFSAAMASLIGNSTPVCFGAVGIPPITGFNTVISGIQESFPSLDPAAFGSQFYSRMAFTNLFTGIFVPALIIASVIAKDGKKNMVGDFVEIFPLCIFSGLIFTVPVYFIATYIGPEIPSMLGALIGLVIMIPAVRAGFLVPKNVWRFSDDPIVETKVDKSKIPLLQAWSPYVVIAIILIITRLPWLPVKHWIDNTLIRMTGFLGVEGVNFNWKFFNNPGLFPFIIIAIIYMLANGLKGADIGAIFKNTFRQVTNAAVALLAGVALVQIMRFTNFSNPSGELESMTTEVAKALAGLFGDTYPLVSPIVGIFGSFVSGSATVSNIMFAALQFKTAVLIGLPTVLIVMCQSMGAAIGNMVCVNNVVAVSATTGARGKEGKLIIASAPPCAIYSLMVSVAAFIYLAIGMSWVA